MRAHDSDMELLKRVSEIANIFLKLMCYNFKKIFIGISWPWGQGKRRFDSRKNRENEW